ncbi:hypothetical protein KIPB_015653, partial [Kipferlia bialata]|eukprot:g15653.t1
MIDILKMSSLIPLPSVRERMDRRKCNKCQEGHPDQ